MKNPISAIKPVGAAPAISSIQTQRNGDALSPHRDEGISLYFHIPFCKKKCHYCHFYVIPDDASAKEKLMEGLHMEWQRWLPSLQGKRVATVYLGGGTPSLLGPSNAKRLLSWITESLPFVNEHPEITLEANPEDITLDLIKAYKEVGINRISIGVQTLNDPLLIRLGRSHNANKAIEAIHTTFLAGINNISIDLMYDLPHQSLATWKHSLAAVRDLPINHLSLYNLTIEPQTVFFKYRESLLKEMPDDNTSLQMYEAAIEQLHSYGLEQYEISAFAKENRIAEHNVGYWTGRPFLGFGPSAFSYWEGRRFRNVAHLNRYHTALKEDRSPVDFEEELEPAAKLRELFLIQLRLLKGVELNLFQQRYAPLDKDTIASLQRLSQEGFLAIKGDNVALTKKGILFYDSVASDLV